MTLTSLIIAELNTSTAFNFDVDTGSGGNGWLLGVYTLKDV